MTIVEINHLQVTFAEKTAVSAASFSVNAGETFSLIGESSCGKSTILRVIAGLQRDWHGQVSLFGHTIKPGMRFQGDLRRNVQMVFQDPYASLHPNHTLWRTLAEPLKIRGEREIENASRLHWNRLACLRRRSSLPTPAFRWSTATCGYCSRPVVTTTTSSAG